MKNQRTQNEVICWATRCTDVTALVYIHEEHIFSGCLQLFAHAVLDVVIDDEIQFLLGESIVFG